MNGGPWHCTGGSDQEHSHEQRQHGCLRRHNKELRKEEKQKAKEKRKDIPIWMQSSRDSKEWWKNLPQRSVQRNRGK